MAGPYSKDLRLRVLAAYELQMQTSEIARAFSVCRRRAARRPSRWRSYGLRGFNGSPGLASLEVSGTQIAAHRQMDAAAIDLADARAKRRRCRGCLGEELNYPT